jgi:glycosyltransferase involved in cell wall biosynthesis
MVDTKTPPKISIIVPVHNVEVYLEKCVDSILKQAFNDFEVILVDDGSTDRSGEICDSYAKQDERVVVFHQNYNGVSAARNVGVQSARGDYIGFVDSDDYIDQNMYSELYRLCQETDSQIAVCKLGREIDGKLINKGDKPLQLEMDNEEAMRQLFKGILYRFSLCNKLFDKDCFNNVQFPEGRIHEDLSTTYKLFANAKKVVYQNFIGYVYVKRSNSILTSKYDEKRLDSFVAWNEIIDFIKTNYPQLHITVISTFTYWCIDHLNYVNYQIKTKQGRRSYLSKINNSIYGHRNDILKNKNLSIRYKYEIYLLNKNISILLLMNKLKHVIKRGG